MDLEVLKERMRAEVDEWATELLDACRQIHARPELGYEERFAHDLLTDVLAGAGVQVERGAHGLPTAFVARAGTEGPTIAVLCEYDALPGLGHACGHNIIATAGLGAGLAAAAVAGEAGGRVVIMGTPAEEGGGGKILMARDGAFEGIDAALMVHPAGSDLTRMGVIAVQEVAATYHGHAAHAAAAPHEGRNALDAAVLGYLNVAALRQHILPTERVHGIVSDGGDKPNIVPARARTEWMVRSGTISTLQPLKARVAAALEAGAAAAACEVELTWKDIVYADLRDNRVMVDLYTRNARALGRAIEEPDDGQAVVGSTDMGNVSYVVPSIHPMIAAAPAGVPIHTAEFERYAGGETGQAAVLDGAIAMAWTIADLWLGDGVLEAARSEFEATMAEVGEAARRSAIGGSSGA